MPPTNDYEILVNYLQQIPGADLSKLQALFEPLDDGTKQVLARLLYAKAQDKFFNHDQAGIDKLVAGSANDMRQANDSPLAGQTDVTPASAEPPPADAPADKADPGYVTPRPDWAKTPPQVQSLTADLPKDNNDYLAGYLGVTRPQIEQQYQSYVNSVNQTIARLPAGKDINVRPLPMNEWVDSQVNNLEGAYKPILDYYSQKYAIDHGGRVPPELMVQLRTAVKNATPAALKAMDQAIVDWQKYLTGAAAGGSAAIAQQGLSQQQAAVQGYLGGPSNVLPSMPFLEDIYSQWDKAHPSQAALDTAGTVALRSQFQKALGRQPTEAEIVQLRGSDQISIDTYISGQPVAGTHLNYGQYSAAATRADTYWKEYFNKAPSRQDITFVAGFQDKQQLEDWIFAQPSHLKGTNIGDYTALSTASDKVSKELWNTPGTSGLTGALASAMGKGG